MTAIRIICQDFSWSKLRIAHEVFSRLLNHFKVFVPFLDLVYAFGQKTQEDQRICDTIYEHISMVDGNDTRQDLGKQSSSLATLGRRVTVT